MISDDERSEVARRLRECRGGWSSGECYYTIIGVLGLPDTSREDGGAALYARLADLIEPPTQCPYYHSDRHHCSAYDDVVDRDALLALADILGSTRETDCRGCRLEGAGCAECSSGVAHEAARRIRKALGVES